MCGLHVALPVELATLAVQVLVELVAAASLPVRIKKIEKIST